MTALLTRALPLLHKLVPASLAIKGLSKINPKLASFVTDSVSAGYSADSIVEYLRDRLTSNGEHMEQKRLENASSLTSQERNILQKRNQESGAGKALSGAIGLGAGLTGLAMDDENGEEMRQGSQPPPIPQQKNMYNPTPTPKQSGLSPSGFPIRQQQQEAQQPQQNQNIIQQYSPELDQFIKERLVKNVSPLKIANEIAKHKRFTKPYQDLHDETGLFMSDIIRSVYGLQESQQQPQTQQKAQQQQQPQQGGIDPALLQIMSQMQNTMNKFKK